MSQRGEVLDVVAGVVLALDLAHPTRVAVEGVTAAGKTTFARELAEAIEQAGRPARSLSMDGYHHPAAHRRRQGPRSADGYYEDAYDLDAFRANVLEPLGPGGSCRLRPAIIDLATDAPVAPAEVEVGGDEVLVVDGSFLGRSELARHWDLRIWLDVPFEVAQARGVARDADRLGGADEASAAFEQRYHAAFRRYLAEVDPMATADVVVDHLDPTRPRLVRPVVG